MKTVEPSDIVALLERMHREHGDMTCYQGYRMAECGDNILAVCASVIEVLAAERARLFAMALQGHMLHSPPTIVTKGEFAPPSPAEGEG